MAKLMVVIVLAALSPASYIKGAEQGKHLFILSGQSNMARLEPNESFTPTVIKEFGKDNVIVVKDAKGGQPIRRWYKKWKPAIAASDAAGQPNISDIRRTRSRTPDSVEKTSPASERAQRRSKNRRPVSRANGDLYNRLMKEVNTAIEGTKIGTVTFVWMQGEADSKEHGQVYAASLKGLIGQLRADLGREDVKFVIGRLSDFDGENKRFPHWTIVRKAQMKVADDDALGAWVDTDDLNTGKGVKGKEVVDDLHYSVEGYKILGRRFADAAISLVKKDSK